MQFFRGYSRVWLTAWVGLLRLQKNAKNFSPVFTMSAKNFKPFRAQSCQMNDNDKAASRFCLATRRFAVRECYQDRWDIASLTSESASLWMTHSCTDFISRNYFIARKRAEKYHELKTDYAIAGLRLFSLKSRTRSHDIPLSGDKGNL